VTIQSMGKPLMIRKTSALLKLASAVWTHPLNRTGRIAALARVAWWQAARLFGDNVVLGFPFVNDTYLYMTRGDTGASGNWYNGFDEPHDMGFIVHVLRQGDTFVDVGANVGSFSIAAAAAKARVVSFEPIPSTFAKLQRNVRFNGLEKEVELHNVGLSSLPGRLRFTASLDSVNHVAEQGYVGSIVEVPVTTMDAALMGKSPTVIKIDVEGFESEVLSGGPLSLREETLLAVVLETNDSGRRYGKDDRSLFETMAFFGFHPFRYDSLTRQLFRVDSASAPKLNTIFLRNELDVLQRCRSAPSFQLGNGML
jgi:FkbM family methyltransferase